MNEIGKQILILESKELDFITIMDQLKNPFIKSILNSNPLYCYIILNELMACLKESKEEDPFILIEEEQKTVAEKSQQIFKFMEFGTKCGFKEAENSFFSFILNELPVHIGIFKKGIANHPKLSSSIVSKIHEVVEQEIDAEDYQKKVITGYISWKFGLVGINDDSIHEEMPNFPKKLYFLVRKKINIKKNLIFLKE